MITIEPANLRDASFVTANLRPADRAEVFCQLPDDYRTDTLAMWSMQAGEAYVAYAKGQPVTFFGTAPMTVCCFSVWAMGTRRFGKAAPAVGRFILEQLVPRRIEQGFTNAEARSMVGNDKAWSWIKTLGGLPASAPFLYGKGGEHFVLFRWTVAGYRSMYPQTRS